MVGSLCRSPARFLPDAVRADVPAAAKEFHPGLPQLGSRAVGRPFLRGITFGISATLCCVGLLVVEVGPREILQMLSAETFPAILEGERLLEAVVRLLRAVWSLVGQGQSSCGAWVPSQCSGGPRAPGPQAYRAWRPGPNAQGPFMRSQSPGSPARASGASLPLASCPASLSSGPAPALVGSTSRAGLLLGEPGWSTADESGFGRRKAALSTPLSLLLSPRRALLSRGGGWGGRQTSRQRAPRPLGPGSPPPSRGRRLASECCPVQMVCPLVVWLL